MCCVFTKPTDEISIFYFNLISTIDGCHLVTSHLIQHRKKEAMMKINRIIITLDRLLTLDCPYKFASLNDDDKIFPLQKNMTKKKHVKRSTN
jgi:hypothetical protein